MQALDVLVSHRRINSFVEQMSLLLRVAIANSLCSVCILLARLASLGSPYSMTNGSHILSPSCCTRYNSYSLYIYVGLRVFCSPSANALLHTKARFFSLALLMSMIILAALQTPFRNQVVPHTEYQPSHFQFSTEQLLPRLRADFNNHV